MLARASQSRRTAFAVAVALAVTGAVVGGPSLRALHYAHVEHVRCAEHGELVHADEAAHGAAGSEPQPHARIGATASSTHGHDHCTVAFVERPRGDGGPAEPASGEVLDLTESLRPQVVSAPPDRALYRLAPKNSPPA